MFKRFFSLCLFPMLLLFVVQAQANVEIAVRGLMKNAVVVEINGKQQLLKVGKTSPEGVKLISANSQEAVFEINGEQHRMGMSKHQGIKFSESENSEFRIPRGANGHFFTGGLINKRSAQFVVDTGASSIALSEVEAQRLGLKYANAPRVPVQTASANDHGYAVNLQSVTVGPITVYNVQAIVLPGRYPEVILLGNSFLNRVDLDINSGVLVMQAKF